MSSPAAVKSATEIRPSEQQLAAMYNAFKQDLTAISTKLGELEMEKEEHKYGRTNPLIATFPKNPKKKPPHPTLSQ